MAEMPMSGARGCDQLAKRSTRWQMRVLTRAKTACVSCGFRLMPDLPNRFQSGFPAGLCAQPEAVLPIRLETAQSDPVLPVG